MKKLLLVIPFLFTLLFSCDKDDESKVDTQIWYLAETGRSGNDNLNCSFFFFKPGDYDPTTFKEVTDISNIWTSGQIKTNSGETVKSFFIDIVLKKDNKYGTYTCDPGEYYIVAQVDGEKGPIWMSKSVSVPKNKITILTLLFDDLFKTGYIEWKEN